MMFLHGNVSPPRVHDVLVWLIDINRAPLSPSLSIDNIGLSMDAKNIYTHDDFEQMVDKLQ